MRTWHKYIGLYHHGDGSTEILVEDYEGPRKMGTRSLPARLEIYNHSPTGFSWGYNGSGPAQAALAICYDHILYQAGGDRAIAKRRTLEVYQMFKSKVIARFDTQANFVLTTDTVEKVINEIRSSA